MNPTRTRYGGPPAPGAPGQLAVPRIIQEFFPTVTGPANQALALSWHLGRRGISSPVLTTTPAGDVPPRASEIDVRRYRPLLALPQFRVAPGLLAALLRERADLLHIHSWRNPNCDGALLAARLRGLPVVAQAHGVAYGYRYLDEPAALRAARKIYELGARPLLLAQADALVASTELEAAELREYGCDPARIAVIPVGVASEFFGEAARAPSGRPTILVVGRLATRRNVEQAIEALALLRGRGVAARLRVVGHSVRLAIGDLADYRSRLEALAHERGVADLVSFAGARHGAALVDEYRAADIFLSTTRYENFGQPIAEAAAAGLPVVATPTGVAPELLADGSGGLLIGLDDAEATASALERLCLRPELRRKMGAAARRYAGEHFDWERIVPRYLALYEALVASPLHRPGGRGSYAHR
jgi:D-inositol-3-phosphate glycosyltransferase